MHLRPGKLSTMTDLTDPTARRRALFALALLAPVPTIGIAAALILWPGPVGRSVFTVAKVWLVVFPIAWYVVVEKGRPSWSPPRRGGLGVGLLVGLASAALIFVTYRVLGVGNIDPAALRVEAAEMGIGARWAYLTGAAYWIFVNSVIEEYVYRWFVQHQCEQLMTVKAAAVASAGIFTLHHVVALATYLDPGLTALASLGIFVAGLIWSVMYSRYRSVWPPWVAHAIADVAVFTCGWLLLF